EASGENLFMVKHGKVVTPLTTSALQGITRDTVIELLKDRGIAVKETHFSRDELYIADEIFLTGTAAEITPVRELDHRKIRTGKPGPVTQQVQKAFDDAVRGRDKKHPEWLAYL